MITLVALWPLVQAAHNTEKDCWIIVGKQVLNVTSFLDKHPGGKAVIIAYAVCI